MSRSSDIPLDAEPVEVLRQWRGRVQLPVGSGGMRPAHQSPRTIGDQQSYAEFVRLIPTERIQMKQPAPPSDDPLLQLPPIDFEQELLLVAFRVDSMYVHPQIERLRVEDGALRGRVSYPARGASAMAAARADVGTYHAVVVRRGAKQIDITDPRSSAAAPAESR